MNYNLAQEESDHSTSSKFSFGSYDKPKPSETEAKVIDRKFSLELVIFFFFWFEKKRSVHFLTFFRLKVQAMREVSPLFDFFEFLLIVT